MVANQLLGVRSTTWLRGLGGKSMPKITRRPPVRVRTRRITASVAKLHPPDGEGKIWWGRLKKALGTGSSDFVNASTGTPCQRRAIRGPHLEQLDKLMSDCQWGPLDARLTLAEPESDQLAAPTAIVTRSSCVIGTTALFSS